MKTKLTTKKRDEARDLLEDHQKASDALDQVSKANWISDLMVTDTKEGDDVVVRLHHTIAKKALAEQKAWTEKELAKLGIEIA